MTKKAAAKPPARGKLKSMRVSSGFRAFVLDQLAALPGMRARSMFGGVGLYADALFFGILASDVLYFKTDDSNRQDYERARSRPFEPYADRAMTMPCCAVPIEIVEDAAALVMWAKRRGRRDGVEEDRQKTIEKETRGLNRPGFVPG